MWGLKARELILVPPVTVKVAINQLLLMRV
jgi:hypothetical protein